MILILQKVVEGLIDLEGKRVQVFIHEFALDTSLIQNQNLVACVTSIVSRTRLDYKVGDHYNFLSKPMVIDHPGKAVEA